MVSNYRVKIKSGHWKPIDDAFHRIWAHFQTNCKIRTDVHWCQKEHPNPAIFISSIKSFISVFPAQIILFNLFISRNCSQLISSTVSSFGRICTYRAERLRHSGFVPTENQLSLFSTFSNSCNSRGQLRKPYLVSKPVLSFVQQNFRNGRKQTNRFWTHGRSRWALFAFCYCEKKRILKIKYLKTKLKYER